MMYEYQKQIHDLSKAVCVCGGGGRVFKVVNIVYLPLVLKEKHVILRVTFGKLYGLGRGLFYLLLMRPSINYVRT